MESITRKSYLSELSKDIIETLLIDRTTKKHLLWATNIYGRRGYRANDSIPTEALTCAGGSIIRPRVEKSKAEIQKRTKDKGEVFTPAWLCNAQNNLVDEGWFGHKAPFNTETENDWIVNQDRIVFSNETNKSWRDYINATQLEVCCGEAPYLVSRYDSVSGNIIPVERRIGLLDRKMRVVNENAQTDEDWLECVISAYKSVYGYEWQGDNVVIARENLLYTFIDHYLLRYNVMPEESVLSEIAKIISWNIWQMDGMKCVVPNSCQTMKIVQYSLFGTEESMIKCEGCEKDNIHKHNGTYCVIKDWVKNRNIPFISLLSDVAK